ncbi:MAG: LuxR C-terminal-related transcriptional regulator [Chloroflexota bacterium]
MDLPTGTVTFLFTDIEGSTRLSKQFPAEMPAALARHHELVRAAIEAQHGVVFQIIGDGICAAFATAPDALHAACAAQRALQNPKFKIPNPNEPAIALRVRMGLHTGAAVWRADQYDGYLTLARVQRIMSAAHGGQVLLSHATASLAREQLPVGVVLRDLGAQRLKDLTQPEPIYQIVSPGLLDDFPPLRTLDSLPNNLPIQLTSFIGREREIAEVTRLLATTRLLTLTGVGGAGKTRLSLQVAAHMLDDASADAEHGFPDGAWFVELAPLSDPTLVPHAIAAALSVREQPNRPLRDTLTDHLQSKRLLLVLDNCEHLIAACAAVADALLRACSHLRMLATSREPLGIGGETVWLIPPLSLANARQRESLERIIQYEAVRLFVERATAVQPRFAVTNDNAPALAQLCERLDGIPLAIELAAARVKALTVEQIAARLDDRFRLLTGGNRTALPRQQTLRALIDWSYDLLSPPERVLLRRLSVFAGGWTLEAAESVCERSNVPTLERFDVLDLLTHLVDKSLVVVDEQGQAARYRLLETIRQYGHEKLREPDALERDEAEQLSRRHAAFFLALAEAAEPELTGPQQLVWLERVETEYDNLRAALGWALDSGGGVPSTRLAVGPRLCGALWRFWDLRSHTMEGSRWLAAAMDAPDFDTAAPALRTKVIRGAGVMALRQSDFERATQFFQTSLRLSREIDDRRGMAGSLNGLGVAASDNVDVGPAYMRESLALFRELNNPWGVARALQNLAIAAFWRDDNQTALRFFEESLSAQREVGDMRLRAMSLSFYGQAVLFQGDPQRAVSLLREALTVQQQVGDKFFIIYCLNGFAAVAAARQQGERAARLLGAAEALGETLGSPLMQGYRRVHARIVADARGLLSPRAFAETWAAGRALSVDEAIALALAEPAEAAVEPLQPESVKPRARRRMFNLTPREQEVATLVAQGQSNREIAAALVLAERTVENHIANILSKLGFASRTQIAVWAVEHGLTKSEP